MLADLDLLLISVFCTADDLLLEKPENARRSLTDAEVVTLAVAQSIMGIPSDARFIKAAVRQLGHLFPALTLRSGYFKRRDRLADTIEWLIGVFASQSPGSSDDLLLIDSTPVECACSRETVKRAGSSSLGGAIADAADYGYCASHSRYFWGMRLHLLCAPDGTPRAIELASPKDTERDVCLRMLARVNRHGPKRALWNRSGFSMAESRVDPRRRSPGSRTVQTPPGAASGPRSGSLPGRVRRAPRREIAAAMLIARWLAEAVARRGAALVRGQRRSRRPASWRW